MENYLKPFKDKWIRISDDTASEEYRIDDIHFDTRFKLIFAIAAHFNVHGFEIQLSYESPPRSGLGGSGVLAITAIAAINKACEAFGESEFSKPYIIELAHNIEDGLRYSYTGMQDQCAAVYGGVNKWFWTCASPELCKRMGEAGRTRVNKEFNIERSIKYLERTYGLILSRH
ncbi:hypothetical protein FJZ31_39815 [Candidatus Poribacteria bacterium]|nr:hypothetical protein [Candidatus Poribacteria bacterium]